MEETARIIALAGLLQDIGTICRRAGCPNKQSRNMLAACLPAGQAYEALLQCIGCHHQAIGVKYIRQNDHIAYLVYRAAEIAAGPDRRSAAEESAFSRGVAYNSQYPQLWTTLQNSLQHTDFLTCTVNQVLTMLQAVAAGIPYSTAAGSKGDFSLYDHSRLTAALAVCLYRYFQAAGISDYRSWCAGRNKIQCRTVPTFLLAAGELTGNRDGLYAVSGIKSEDCLEKWLSVFELSRAHLLSADGARFSMLLPNIPEVISFLEAANGAGNDWMLTNCGTSMHLTLTWQKVSADALTECQPAGKPSPVLIRQASIVEAMVDAADYRQSELYLCLRNKDSKRRLRQQRALQETGAF
ncbi:hypothetical protein [Sporomusa acidovorans]|uniref:CRISPR system single-strand-specific deoxyribonuclease Cas10/Csm1 (Subtype III-A) n=1 Tax=Sporomusa acidovorans (strain ATCC 49682 / DSM 3132 / Mol) TaxID=1123286 RepID=A0ABZ3J4L6_SPOA4|nr:hypothetical protein [Sporomusa acidovorans]OZC23935.1 hypothetical protein SPACI_03530 [Sporomusa acidovorans DSM 3132]SDF31482.1 CRISPR-associated protein Cas10/Csm1, subtype III-A/MTUBE [Sporomusa acidovorans]